MVRLARAVAHHPLIYFPVAALAAGFLAIGSYACNQAAKRTGSKPPRRGFCSSVFMVMRLDERLSLSLPRFELDELPLQVHSAINNADEALLKQSYASPLEPLVITTTEHASRLSIVLARYKFVANLLAGRHQVCELGRSDSFGIRLVLAQVKKVAVYDSDETFVAKFRRRNQDVCTLHADVHDVVQEHLPRSHDAIYSFDVLERTGPEYEEDCVRHLRDSLSDNCSIAIIGCSSPDRDVQLSDSTTAPLYTRTGLALRELLQRQCSSVILFSMSDEIIQPSISPNAQYFLAICCSKKT